MLHQRSDELLGLVQAMAQVLRWVAATPGAGIARVVGQYFPQIPCPLLAAALHRYRALGLYADGPVLRREGFDRLQQAMLSGGALSRAIPFEACVDNTLAEKSLAVDF